MNELDLKIREALSAEDAELARELEGEQSMLQMVSDSFRGRHRWLVVIVFVAVTAFVGLGAFSAIRFFRAEDTREMILWAGMFGFCLLAIAANKIWYWMELNKNAVTREVKRVELQIAQLANELRRS